jgi:hypothetical protein
VVVVEIILMKAIVMTDMNAITAHMAMTIMMVILAAITKMNYDRQKSA